MKLYTLFSVVLISVAQIVTAQTLHFAATPALSPDGTEIYFSYDGDIFRVPATGGLAMRFISIGGVETRPKVSPDGKYLAFASDVQGNNDLYIVPVAGGDVRQLTFHEASDLPSSWSPDSKYIYFESGRSSSRVTTYKVSIDGGTPTLMFDNYFNTIVNLTENPLTGDLYFNESSEAINFPTRKRYVGDHNSNIKSWNESKKEYKELTTYIGKDTWPMVDRNGNLYYVSDQYNKESNIVKYRETGNPEQLTKFNKSVQYPSVSYNGTGIVFLKDYKINYLDLKSGKVTEPEITIANGNVELRQSFKDQKPSSAAVSPDGKKFALVIRGLLYVSDTKGKYLQKLNTPEDERVDDVIWASDNKTIYYTRTNKGWTDLYKVKADMSEPEKNVYTSKSNVKNLSISHKGDKMAFVDGSRKLMIMSIPSDKVDQIATVEFWSFQNYNLHFSFDDSCLAFESMNKFEPDIFIYSFKDKKLTNLTNSASTERDAWFTPDGKYMYLLANPTSSSFPRGSYGSLYKLPLQKYDTPYKSENYDKLFTKDKPKKDSAVTIDYNDIFRRMTIAAGGGSQYGLYMFSSKGKSWLFYNSQNAGKRACYSLELSDPEAKPREIKDIRGYGFFNSESDLYLFGDGTIYKIDPNSLSTTKIAISQSVEKSLRSEFDQMFYEVWAVLEQNFYDVKYHGADWYKVRDYYASFLPYVTSRQNVRTLITDMLGELNSSHLGFNSRGEEETTKTKVYSTATGIIFRNDAPYTVDRILTDSPADKVEVDVQNGDVLVAVDGVKIDTKDNREKYFASPLVKEEIKLTFKRSDKEFDVKLHTMSYSTQKNLLYTEWEDSRKAMVEKIGKGKVAYIHMRDMGDGSLNSFLQDMHTYAVNKDALILDLRYNNGGNVHKEVLDFLRQQEHFRWSYRDFPKTSHPNVVPARKPIVVLVNEHSLSDAEVTSNGIKTLNIAKIVGTETYRWIIFTSSVRLIDGSSCRMPAWGCYTLEGTDLESIGVKPDIYVKNTFKDRLMGLDPQLETALKEVMR
ncbi:MAG: S41 family peptidase [Bacteroidales bacterium]|nr:S41 family peptidase [Bacteroidales bacterium]MDD4670654.1 S41 family peptidase [Bacteroidales bacterium]